jgi:sulfite exporter TauE/SafE
VIALLGAVLVASVVGSVHCVAMCGPLIALHGRGGLRHGAALHHAGRLAGYVVLGVLAGAIGSAVDLAGRALAIQRAAMIVAGVIMLVAGVVALATALGWHRPSARPHRAFDVAIGRLRRVSPGRRAALFGALTAVLPCGWLWAFVVTAAGTGHPAIGAAVMAVFWLGTLPLLVGATVVLAPVLGALRTRLPFVTAVILLALGTAALIVRMPLLVPADGVAACHRVEAPEPVR